mmetsp:Transcript_22421/g.45882  ORF Transcript_22421/g.45882 Transcript_22421/m.45882 type:complete len:246 (+) Transcript_22421:3586-4323(+)
MPTRLTKSLSGRSSVRRNWTKRWQPRQSPVLSMPKMPANTSLYVLRPTKLRYTPNSFPSSRWLAKICKRIFWIPSSSTLMPRPITSPISKSSSMGPMLQISNPLATDASPRVCTMQPRSFSRISTTILSLHSVTFIWRNTEKPFQLPHRRTTCLPGSKCALLVLGLENSVLLLPVVLKLLSTLITWTKLSRTIPILATSITLFPYSNRVLDWRTLTSESSRSSEFSIPSTSQKRLWSTARFSSAS